MFSDLRKYKTIYASQHEKHIQAGDVKLAPLNRRIINFYFGPKIEAYGFANQRIGTANQRLAGNDSCCSGNEDTRQNKPSRHDKVKRITIAQCCSLLAHHP